ncbi:MAG: hydroxymethylglutaryl-CoA reductase, degradative [Bacteroidales bacterium]|nr:hydroxymethylglutaryl-CoA reductase, degradative [Bacteroidales bacterium]
MIINNVIRGFSKLTEEEKRNFIAGLCIDPAQAEDRLEHFLVADENERTQFLELSENTISSFHTPYGIAPNLRVNGKVYHVPLAIEESSVVAAVSHSARFWAEHGGFTVTGLSTVKLGHVYFRWFGNPSYIREHWRQLKLFLLERLKKITTNMVGRGGGILSLELQDETLMIDNLFKIELKVETVNSMGANFVNTCLEDMAEALDMFFNLDNGQEGRKLQVAMAILSNYTPECTVTIEASCEIDDLKPISGWLPVEVFTDKLRLAYQIAHHDPYRAVTHNKGIMNGVDAVLMATGNDSRAAEAAAHAFAARDGQYRALSHCSVNGNRLSIGLTIPIALGTVGGITNLHPLARLSLEILGNPTAKELMGVVASVGLASNFAAVRSLVTTGIQKGHMRLHLSNILNMLNVTNGQREEAELYFNNRTVSFNAVKHFLHEITH